jgi:hypothetical protein
MAAMKTTGVCLCDSPLRFEHGYCGRCWNRQFATDAGAHGQPNPLSADAPPVPTAGAGRPTTPAPAASSPYGAAGEHPYHWADGPADCFFCQQFAAFDDDYTEAFGNTDGLRIRAAFDKRTGRP